MAGTKEGAARARAKRALKYAGQPDPLLRVTAERVRRQREKKIDAPVPDAPTSPTLSPAPVAATAPLTPTSSASSVAAPAAPSPVASAPEPSPVTGTEPAEPIAPQPYVPMPGHYVAHPGGSPFKATPAVQVFKVPAMGLDAYVWKLGDPVQGDIIGRGEALPADVYVIDEHGKEVKPKVELGPDYLHQDLPPGVVAIFRKAEHPAGFGREREYDPELPHGLGYRGVW